MRLPALTELATAKDNTEEFKGYNQNLRNEVGEWYDQKNMTTDYYPTASPRDKRAVQTYPKGIQLPLSYSDYGVKPEGLGIAYTDNRLFTLQPFSYGEETIGAWFVDNGKLACITAGDSGKIFNNVQFSIHPSINFDNEYDSFQTITISDGKNNKNTNAEYYIRTRPGAGSLPVYAGIYNKNSRKFYNSVSSSGGTMHLIWSFYSSPIWEFYDTTGYNMVASSPFSLTKTTVINIPSSMPKYGSNGLKAFISCEDNEQSSIVIYRAGRETDVQEDHPDDKRSVRRELHRRCGELGVHHAGQKYDAGGQCKYRVAGGLIVSEKRPPEVFIEPREQHDRSGERETGGNCHKDVERRKFNVSAEEERSDYALRPLREQYHKVCEECPGYTFFHYVCLPGSAYAYAYAYAYGINCIPY